jgi:3-hydroxy-9,10-secoandrosta-1,3,5(10)-triene-9,17-dione monooxygenase reductase component
LKNNLRKCLSLFSTGITAITSQTEDNLYEGITVNSFSSVSLKPPIVMWCLDKKTKSKKNFIKKNKEYKIIFLSANQKKDCYKLASKNNKFDHDHEVNLLKKSMGYLTCKLYKKFNAGDHIIILHKVIKFKINPKKKPLIFFRSKVLA